MRKPQRLNQKEQETLDLTKNKNAPEVHDAHIAYGAAQQAAQDLGLLTAGSPAEECAQFPDMLAAAEAIAKQMLAQQHTDFDAIYEAARNAAQEAGKEAS